MASTVAKSSQEHSCPPDQIQSESGRDPKDHSRHNSAVSKSSRSREGESAVDEDVKISDSANPACTESVATSSKTCENGDLMAENCAHICIECGKFFPSFPKLEAHMKDHSTKMFKCKFCDMSFTRNEYLKAHTRTHTGTRPYICKECGAAFAASTNLSKHKRIHSGDRRFKCQFCGRAFVQSGHLKKHINSQHKDGKVLLEALKSQQHSSSAAGSSRTGEATSGKSSKGPHVCTECGAKFARAKNLKIHMLKHSGVKAFVCNECGQAFAIATYLREHQRTHSAARPYTCSVCSLGFKASTNLYKHMRIHTGEKRFVCKECGQAFTQSGNLKKHMSRHTTDKPFICTVCNAAFGRDDYLRKHKKSHVGESLFICMECGAGFNSAHGLTKHQQNHNNESAEHVADAEDSGNMMPAIQNTLTESERTPCDGV